MSCVFIFISSVLLPGKSHGQGTLVSCRRRLSDFTFTFHFSLSCTREGNVNLLQCSCLENPRDGGAWWAAVYGIAQSRTRLKRLGSSRLFHQTISCMSVKWKNRGGAVPGGPLSGRSGCLFIFSALKIHGQTLIFPVLNLKTVFSHVFCTWTPQEKYHLIKWKVRGFLWAMHV